MSTPRHACLGDIPGAQTIFFIYHCSRSRMEVDRARAEAKGAYSSRKDATQAHVGRPALNVIQLATRGDAPGVLWRDGGIDDEIVRVLMWRAEISKVVFARAEGGLCIGRPHGRPHGLKDLDWEHTPSGVPADHFVNAHQYRQGLERAILHLRDEIRHRDFFTALDSYTASELIPTLPFGPLTRAAMAADADMLGTVLLASLLTRSRATCAHLTINVTPSPFGSMAERLRALAEKSYGKHWIERLEDGLELFAAGRLKTSFNDMTTCQPNSSYFFLFAELALALCKRILDGLESPLSWEQALRFANAAVRSQVLYARSYGSYARARVLAGEQPSLPDYRSFDFSEDPKAPKFEEQRDALRKDFADAGFVDLCNRSAEHVRRHLPGWVFAPRAGSVQVQRA